MHSEGILAGELKHGPLALVDKQMPVIMVIMKDPCFAKCQNALQQVTARQVRALLQTEVPAFLFRTTRNPPHRRLSAGVTTLCPVALVYVYLFVWRRGLSVPWQMSGNRRTTCRS